MGSYERISNEKRVVVTGGRQDAIKGKMQEGEIRRGEGRHPQLFST
jgi:hypothetical protein